MRARRGRRAVLPLFLVAALASCGRPPSTTALLDHKDYKTARARAEARQGRAWALLDTWVRGRARLTLSAEAAEARLSDEVFAWPLHLKVRLSLVSAPLVSTGTYHIYVRSDGLLWGGAVQREKEWADAASLTRLLGGGPAWAPWPGEEAARKAWSGFSLACHATSVEPKDHCEANVVLMPIRPALGPAAVIVDADLEWPDTTQTQEQAHVEFVFPLPPAPSLAERVSALFAGGQREVGASPREIARE